MSPPQSIPTSGDRFSDQRELAVQRSIGGETPTFSQWIEQEGRVREAGRAGDPGYACRVHDCLDLGGVPVLGWLMEQERESGQWLADNHVQALTVPFVPGGGGSTRGVVYRGLAEGEDIARGLVARAPGATNVSPLSHVAGNRESPWISTTKSLEVARTKYGQNGVVAIDLDRVGSEIVDVSGGFGRSGGRFSSYAIADQEVLIRGYVPPGAVSPPR